MARRRRGRPLSGWLVIDKPAGLTSAAVVARVRHIIDAAKAGHAGSLDPIATGVLPVALGEATKTVAYAMAGRKAYRFTIRWGEARTTDDVEGEVTALSEARPTEAEIQGALGRFVGEFLQTPPPFSAIKVAGRRAYALARNAEPPELAPRPVTVHRFELVARPDRDHAEFAVACGKGTYMRSLARDLALAVGTVGHVAALRRTEVGPFTEKDAISLDKLAALGHSAAETKHLLAVETALDDIPALALTESEAGRLRRGQPVPVIRTADRECIRDLADGAVLCAMLGGKVVALTRLDGTQVHPVRVLNL